ncbi:MAG: helix-turn-helix domain-containing protein, partial [Chitinophagaceae bacterium]
MFTNQESIKLIFGLKIRSLRQQLGYNYQKLSEETGIAISYLHDMEAGKKYPKADKIIVLAKVLKVDYDYLVSLNASKKLQPIVELLNSDFMNAVPWEHFGLTPATLIELFANTPDKVTAFISTLIKLSRSIQMSKENFYTSALRSFQDLHDNYFEEIELAVSAFKEKIACPDDLVLSTTDLENWLKSLFGILVDKKTLANKETLKGLRSFFASNKKVLYLGKGFSTSQEKFLMGRELGFQYLQLTPRPFETIVQQPESFDVLLNNFKASYFASALLMPEDKITEWVQKLFSSVKWQEEEWMQAIQSIDVSAEMFLQRLTNILPGHFGIDQLFFLRMNGNIESNRFDITKELHLSKLHNPYANVIQEHYCRRWIAISCIKDAYEKNKGKKQTKTIVASQISQYWQTHNKYLCITFAKPTAKDANNVTSVTVGILIDAKLQQKILFVNDK